jgi:hypothetical protein
MEYYIIHASFHRHRTNFTTTNYQLFYSSSHHVHVHVHVDVDSAPRNDHDEVLSSLKFVEVSEQGVAVAAGQITQGHTQNSRARHSLFFNVFLFRVEERGLEHTSQLE